MNRVSIEGPYITLGQLLKKLDLIDTGGQAKYFLEENDVFVNQVLERRRGRKLYPNDTIEIKGYGAYQICEKE
jgi:S4 domain protein YaaA